MLTSAGHAGAGLAWSEPFPDEVRRARRLGGGGVTGEEVGALEDRLGAMLPTSYRQFLLTSNGWRKHRA